MILESFETGNPAGIPRRPPHFQNVIDTDVYGV